MGLGFLETFYEKCMMIALKRNGLRAVAQQPIAARYQDVIVGDFVADLIVEDAVIVELKSIRRLSKNREAQLVNYLVATGKPVASLLSFGEEKVEVKGKIRVFKNMLFFSSCCSIESSKEQDMITG